MWYIFIILHLIKFHINIKFTLSLPTATVDDDVFLSVTQLNVGCVAAAVAGCDVIAAGCAVVVVGFVIDANFCVVFVVGCAVVVFFSVVEGDCAIVWREVVVVCCMVIVFDWTVDAVGCVVVLVCHDVVAVCCIAVAFDWAVDAVGCDVVLVGCVVVKWVGVWWVIVVDVLVVLVVEATVKIKKNMDWIILLIFAKMHRIYFNSFTSFYATV